MFTPAIGPFVAIDTKIALSFLTRFDTQDRADWLTFTRMSDWPARQDYSGRTNPELLYKWLLDAARCANGVRAINQAAITASHVSLLRTLLEQVETLSDQIDRKLDAHTDTHIPTSLPRSSRI